MGEPLPARIPDLHKSAFWIFALTATVMREAIYTVFHQANTAGWSDSTVQLEALRTLVVLLLMARQMLSAGIYFDQVYLEPDSAAQFPRRSYPFDFLFSLTELMMTVGASTTYALPSFDVCVALNLVWSGLWLVVSSGFGYSSVRMIAPGAAANAATLGLCIGVRAVAGEAAAAATLLVVGSAQVAYFIRRYNVAALKSS